jgi:hypothetical protein
MDRDNPLRLSGLTDDPDSLGIFTALRSRDGVWDIKWTTMERVGHLQRELNQYMRENDTKMTNMAAAEGVGV